MGYRTNARRRWLAEGLAGWAEQRRKHPVGEPGRADRREVDAVVRSGLDAAASGRALRPVRAEPLRHVDERDALLVAPGERPDLLVHDLEPVVERRADDPAAFDHPRRRRRRD